MKEVSKNNKKSKHRLLLNIAACLVLTDIILLIKTLVLKVLFDFDDYWSINIKPFYDIFAELGFTIIIPYLIIFFILAVLMTIRIKNAKSDERKYFIITFIKKSIKYAIYYILAILSVITLMSIKYFDEIYSSLLLELLIFCVYYNIKKLYKYIIDKERYKRKSKKSIVVFVVVCLFINVMLARNINNTSTYGRIGYENTPTGWSVVYNKDGTIKHNKDGSIVEDVEWDRKAIYGYSKNYLLLLYPIASILITYVFFFDGDKVKEKEIEEYQKNKKKK